MPSPKRLSSKRKSKRSSAVAYHFSPNPRVFVPLSSEAQFLNKAAMEAHKRGKFEQMELIVELFDHDDLECDYFFTYAKTKIFGV